MDKSSGCWLWTYKTDKDGYGGGMWEKQKYMAHRVMCEHGNGVRPEGKQVLHSCHNPSCCNPNHLRWGTVLENQQDAARRGSRKGSKNGRAKLNEAAVRIVRASPRNTTDLARLFGVCWDTIKRARKGESWKHV